MQASTLAPIRDPTRLAALRETGLLDTAPDPDFDHLTALVPRILRAPTAFATLVDKDRQLFISQVGIPEPWASRGSTPLSHSFCKYVVASGEPLLIEDAREHSLVQDNPAIAELHPNSWFRIPRSEIRILITPIRSWRAVSRKRRSRRG